MKKFNEHDTVIYTDAAGRLIDTFVIYDTDPLTGLTHINHENLKVPEKALTLHPNTIVQKYNMPMNDAFSFEIFKKLKEKFDGTENQAIRRELKVESVYKEQLAKAS
ncbi:hypothetical protein KXD93_19200 [Mucilaginibacter sp. BJC16-A38]|uniref:hypothetical protein n=1 Tax=Mucilaginibacter phenanthrenivorans TaxID=1234842 RepID=UPI00215791C5|nr:hypothetical protein [Mucilaginibacter phenanthrenivorans]MCR8559785.1 hypothetical protein [Mucilaginibacter phenanthrenivorans]